MNAFLNQTMTDIRRGRQSWRVFVVFCAPSFSLAVLIGVAQRIA